MSCSKTQHSVIGEGRTLRSHVKYTAHPIELLHIRFTVFYDYKKIEGTGPNDVILAELALFLIPKKFPYLLSKEIKKYS